MRRHEIVLGFMGFLILPPTWFLLSGGLPSGARDRSAFLIPAVLVFLVLMAWLGVRLGSRRVLAMVAAIVDGDAED